MDKQNSVKYSSVALAFVGDSVFSTYIRQKIVEKYDKSANELTRMANKYVCAGGQYNIYRKIEPNLTQEELQICHHARNAHLKSKAKNFSVTEYIYATAFEALVGYLHLTNQQKRLNEILVLAVEDV